MHTTSILALLAGSAVAQSTIGTVVVLNYIWSDKTVTYQGGDSTATTYTNACPTGGGLETGDTQLLTIVDTSTGIPPSQTSLSDGDDPTTQLASTDINLTPISAPPSSPTAAARRRWMRRQDDDERDNDTFCEPYTLVQGASTWEFHLTDPVPGAWTFDSNCSWSGTLTTADITCTATQQGTALGNTGVTVTTFPHNEVTDMEALVTATVVSGSVAGNVSTPLGTPTGSGVSSESPSGTGSQSTGLAPPGSMPTGAMIIGGAAGLFAAALAL